MKILNSWSNFKTNESTAVRNNDYIISGIEIPQSLVNSYVKKIKDETGTNLRHMYSDSYIAEQIVKFVVSEYSDIDKLPLSILLGEDVSKIESELEDEGTETVDTETENLEVTEDEIEDDVEEEFEEIDEIDETDEDDAEDEFEEIEETDEEDEEDEEDELPI